MIQRNKLLNRFVRNRPKQLLVVYVEPQRVDVLKVRRKWRAWQLESVEQLAVPEGEGIFEALQRINLRPKSSSGTALLLLLPRLYYGFHREYYPASLSLHLEETLRFDWSDNIFQEPGKTFHFFGQAVPVDHHLSVPIFTLQDDFYEKLYQTLNGSNFQSLNVVPVGPVYRVFLNKYGILGDPTGVHILARVSDASTLEVHKFYQGALLESALIRNEECQLALLRETLRASPSSENGEPSVDIPIYLLCQPGESGREHIRQWQREDLPIEIIEVPEPLITYWVDHLLEQDPVETFNPPLILKPWNIPKAAWVIVAILVLYSLFGFYQVHSHQSLAESLQVYKRQRAQLEAEWKPIEELQTRVGKFQEDQKALAQFNDKGYPLLGILTLLTERTPQDTWLNYLSLREGELMLRGESVSAIKYLTELSQVKGFEDVRFASPVTRTPSSDHERFNVQIRVNMQLLRATLETLSLDGGGGELPKATAGSKPPTPPTPASAAPVSETAMPGQEPAAVDDDNATSIEMSSPTIEDDNATLNQSAR